MKDLTEKAMLVRHRVSYWDARKYDKAISDEIAESKNASHDAGRYNKALISRDALKELRQIKLACKTHHHTMTLPWDKGLYILPADAYIDYMKRQQQYRIEYENAAQSFLSAYPQYVDDAREALGDMFNEKDYPSVQDLQHRFGIRIIVMPLPSAGDFRVELSKTETRKVRTEIERHVHEQVQRAVQDLWNRVYSAVEHMRDVLSDEDKRISKAVVSNLRDIVDLLPKLNFTGDADLERMRQQLSETLCVREVDVLRDNPEIRKEQAQQADDILATMSGYIGG